jgi:hypothetical protein
VVVQLSRPLGRQGLRVLPPPGETAILQFTRYGATGNVQECKTHRLLVTGMNGEEPWSGLHPGLRLLAGGRLVRCSSRE